jgi:hypothetical protein
MVFLFEGAIDGHISPSVVIEAMQRTAGIATHQEYYPQDVVAVGYAYVDDSDEAHTVEQYIRFYQLRDLIVTSKEGCGSVHLHTAVHVCFEAYKREHHVDVCFVTQTADGSLNGFSSWISEIEDYFDNGTVGFYKTSHANFMRTVQSVQPDMAGAAESKSASPPPSVPPDSPPFTPVHPPSAPSAFRQPVPVHPPGAPSALRQPVPNVSQHVRDAFFNPAPDLASAVRDDIFDTFGPGNHVATHVLTEDDDDDDGSPVAGASAQEVALASRGSGGPIAASAAAQQTVWSMGGRGDGAAGPSPGSTEPWESIAAPPPAPAQAASLSGGYDGDAGLSSGAAAGSYPPGSAIAPVRNAQFEADKHMAMKLQGQFMQEEADLNLARSIAEDEREHMAAPPARETVPGGAAAPIDDWDDWDTGDVGHMAAPPARETVPDGAAVAPGWGDFDDWGTERAAAPSVWETVSGGAAAPTAGWSDFGKWGTESAAAPPARETVRSAAASTESAQERRDRIAAQKKEEQAARSRDVHHRSGAHDIKYLKTYKKLKRNDMYNALSRELQVAAYVGDDIAQYESSEHAIPTVVVIAALKYYNDSRFRYKHLINALIRATLPEHDIASVYAFIPPFIRNMQNGPIFLLLAQLFFGMAKALFPERNIRGAAHARELLTRKMYPAGLGEHSAAFDMPIGFVSSPAFEAWSKCYHLVKPLGMEDMPMGLIVGHANKVVTIQADYPIAGVMQKILAAFEARGPFSFAKTKLLAGVWYM